MSSLSNFEPHVLKGTVYLLKDPTALSVEWYYSHNLIPLGDVKLSIFLKFKNNYSKTWYENNQGHHKIINVARVNSENVLFAEISSSKDFQAYTFYIFSSC